MGSVKGARNNSNKWDQTPLVEKYFKENNDFKRVNA